MANETTTATTTGFIASHIISDRVAWYLKSAMPLMQSVRLEKVGPGTKTAAFPRVTKQTALSGTITEGTGLSNTAFAATNVTATVAEVGILRQHTKLNERTNMLGQDGLRTASLADGVYMCLEKFETDCWAQFANPSTSSGLTGAAFTIAHFAGLLAQAVINKADVTALLAFLTTKQSGQLRTEVASSGAGVFAAGLGNDIMKPPQAMGYIGSLFGIPSYTSDLYTISGANGFGAMVVDGAARPEGAPFGVAWAWMPEEARLENPAFSGGLQQAVTMAFGHVEILDGAYVQALSQS